MGDNDEPFEADESGRTPGPAVSDKVRQGGTRPAHDGEHQGDRSPHDAEKTRRPDIAPDQDRGEAGLDRDDACRSQDAEQQQRALSIRTEDRAAPGK